jgi:hypothetical protein
MPSFPPGVHVLGGKNGGKVLARLATEYYRDILPIVAELRRTGLSLRAIASELGRRGIKTRYQNGPWSPVQVNRLLARDAEARRPAADPEPQPQTSSSPPPGQFPCVPRSPG